MAIKEFDTVLMPDGRIGTLVDIYADGKKGIVEDMEMIGDEYKLYDVLISELREVPDWQPDFDENRVKLYLWDEKNRFYNH